MYKYIKEYKNKKFKWGEFDCCIFCNNVLKDIHGKDYLNMKEFDYSTKREAMEILKETPLDSLLTERLGDPVSCKQLGRGDIGYLKIDGGTIGIVVDERIVVPKKPKGLAFHKTSECIKGWNIGR